MKTSNENKKYQKKYYLALRMGAIKLDILNKSFRLQKVEDNFLNINEKACAGVYVFGFGGQEKDDEVFNVTGSSYTANSWQYDSRLGRRWNLDPVDKPWESSYATFNNNPIRFVDIDGRNADDPPWVYGQLYSESLKEGHITSGDIKKNLIGVAAILMTPVIIFGGEAVLPYLASWGLSLAPYATSTALLAGRYGPDAIAFAGGALGYDGEIPGTSGDELGRLVNKGLKVGATKFYSKFSSFSSRGSSYIASHLKGIDFSKDVFETVLEKGTKVVQYVDDATGKVGNYFAPVGTDASTLGIKTKGRTPKIFTLSEDVKVLQSTAADYTDEASGAVYSGGGTQFFSPDIKNNIDK